MTQSFIGTWRSESNPAAFLTFTTDHRVNGSDGINKLRTSWTADDTGVSIASAVTTMMAVKNLQAWVTSARSVEVDEDELVVYDSQKKELGRLHRDTETPSK